MAGVRPSIENPILYTDVNINGTVNLLEQCKKHNIKNFVLLLHLLYMVTTKKSHLQSQIMLIFLFHLMLPLKKLVN